MGNQGTWLVAKPYGVQLRRLARMGFRKAGERTDRDAEFWTASGRGGRVQWIELARDDEAGWVVLPASPPRASS